MFHTMPYGEAQARGAAQNEILDRLTVSATGMEQVDLERAESLIMSSELLKHPASEDIAV